MEREVGETVYIMTNNLNPLKGVVTDKKLEGDRYKYIVKFKVKDENGEYETSSPWYEWSLFSSEEECLQHEYDREKAYIDVAQTYLNKVKEKLDKIKEEKHNCKNCLHYHPERNLCVVHNMVLDENNVDGCECGYCEGKRND